MNQDWDARTETGDSLQVLILKMAQGDSSAWACVFNLVEPKLTSHLQYRFSSLDPNDIQDIVQETVWKSFSCARQYRGANDASAFAWIKRIARCLALDLVEKHTRSAVLADEGGPRVRLENPARLPKKNPAGPREFEDSIFHGLLDTEWQKFKRVLSPRELLVLRWIYDGLPKVKIAKRLKIAPPRVNQIVDRIRQKAKAIFGDF